MRGKGEVGGKTGGVGDGVFEAVNGSDNRERLVVVGNFGSDGDLWRVLDRCVGCLDWAQSVTGHCV